MTKDAREILKKAMSMRPGDRALIAGKLLRSLEEGVDRDVDAAWQHEAAKRLRELQKGRVQSVPWESVRDQLRKHKRATG